METHRISDAHCDVDATPLVFAIGTPREITGYGLDGALSPAIVGFTKIGGVWKAYYYTIIGGAEHGEAGDLTPEHIAAIKEWAAQL